MGLVADWHGGLDGCMQHSDKLHIQSKEEGQKLLALETLVTMSKH